MHDSSLELNVSHKTGGKKTSGGKKKRKYKKTEKKKNSKSKKGVLKSPKMNGCRSTHGP